MDDNRFDTCHAITARWEGGWSNHAADPGGKTMYGITEAVYHAWLRMKGRATTPVRNITMAEALEIYRDQYWNPTAGKYKLQPGVDLATYDAAVNAGVSRGVKWLLASLDKNDRHDRTVKAICAARLSFKQGLSIWKTFGKGWARRVADIEARGVAMALAVMNDVPDLQQHLEDEAIEARKTAGKQEGGAAIGGSGAAGGTVAQPELAADPAAGWILLVVLIAMAAGAGFLIWRSRINRARQAAYEQIAAEEFA